MTRIVIRPFLIFNLFVFQTYPDWEPHKNVMLSSFFWGYVCFQIVAGQLAKKYGPKYFIGSAKLIGSVFCLLIPFFGAWCGYQGVIACRIITGMSQGFIFPCIHQLISSWTPLQDRAKIGSFAYAGRNMASITVSLYFPETIYDLYNFSFAYIIDVFMFVWTRKTSVLGNLCFH